jgi:hypothetical protein
MLALRFAGLLAAAVWFGGLLTLGALVAPAVFDAMAAQHVADPRVLSGAVVGEILRRFHLVSYGCAVVALASLVARAVLGPRPRRFALRAGLIAAMFAASLYSGLVLRGQIDQLRQEIGAAPSSLRADDDRRVRFGRLHAQASAIQIVPLVGSLLLLAFELKD